MFNLSSYCLLLNKWLNFSWKKKYDNGTCLNKKNGELNNGKLATKSGLQGHKNIEKWIIRSENFFGSHFP